MTSVEGEQRLTAVEERMGVKDDVGAEEEYPSTSNDHIGRLAVRNEQANDAGELRAARIESALIRSPSPPPRLAQRKRQTHEKDEQSAKEVRSHAIKVPLALSARVCKRDGAGQVSTCADEGQLRTRALSLTWSVKRVNPAKRKTVMSIAWRTICSL
jgi:hypothetical protein